MGHLVHQKEPEKKTAKKTLPAVRTILKEDCFDLKNYPFQNLIPDLWTIYALEHSIETQNNQLVISGA